MWFMKKGYRYAVVAIFVIGYVRASQDLSTQSAEGPGDQFLLDEGASVPTLSPPALGLLIKDIRVEGNHHVSSDAVINKVTYRIGQPYTVFPASQTIRNVMAMGNFRKVDVQGEFVDNGVIVYLVVDEKKPIQEIIFKNNRHFARKDLEKKIDFSGLVAADEADLHAYAMNIRRLYREKDYHDVRVTVNLEPAADGKKVIAVFDIDEGKKTVIKRVKFVGNRQVGNKRLKALMFTREDWILGFMDRSGSYQPDALEADRHAIESFYQSNGFFNAKVTDVSVAIDPETKEAEATFHIYEGELYTISQVGIGESPEYKEEEILPFLPIRAGHLYSKEAIRQAMDLLRTLWGQRGYIYVDVIPSLESDDKSKTVKITFYVEPGDKVYANRINISGNIKTRDKVIRRQMLLGEGELLTINKLEESKRRIEGLGYFDQREGVAYKLSRIDQEYADVDISLKEVKTGRVEAQFGFGGSPKDLQSPTTSARIMGLIADTNLFGTGMGLNLSASYSKEERQVMFNLTEPWLFDRPIYAAIDTAFKQSVYEEFRLTESDILEQMASGSLSSGFMAQSLGGTKIVTQLGVQGIHYTREPEVKVSELTDPVEQAEYAAILKKRFPQGAFGWLGWQAGQDIRNHPMHPSYGYQWLLQTKIGFPGPTGTFGFWKVDCDASWYTPLVGERSLVLALHAHFGSVTAFKGHAIPFRELYHIGGPASVRGFLFGQIGPMYKGVDSLGGTKALWINAELVFPIAPDFSIKGALFYDGGSGWDTPDASQIAKQRLKHNGFDFRQAIGFGFRIYNPTPVKIDWGFKLDRRKGESASEVHLTMAHDF